MLDLQAPRDLPELPVARGTLALQDPRVLLVQLALLQPLRAQLGLLAPALRDQQAQLQRWLAQLVRPDLQVQLALILAFPDPQVRPELVQPDLRVLIRVFPALQVRQDQLALQAQPEQTLQLLVLLGLRALSVRLVRPGLILLSLVPRVQQVRLAPRARQALTLLSLVQRDRLDLLV